MAKFSIIRPDVWGNEDDGWEVNDEYHVGTFEALETDSDEMIVRDLAAAGYLEEGSTLEDVAVVGDWELMFLMDADTTKPLLRLAREH